MCMALSARIGSEICKSTTEKQVNGAQSTNDHYSPETEPQIGPAVSQRHGGRSRGEVKGGSDNSDNSDTTQSEETK